MLLLFLTSVAITQDTIDIGTKGDSNILCVDIVIHIYTDAEILDEFNGDLTTLNTFDLDNLDTVCNLLAPINVSLILDGIANYKENPWGDAPSRCAEYIL